MPIVPGGNVYYTASSESASSSNWDAKSIELTIEKMMRALAFKLKRDGLSMPKHVDVAGMVYTYLKERRGYDQRFMDGDLTLLDEFIDSEWPRLVEAAKSVPPALEPGFTELPKPKKDLVDTYASLFWTELAPSVTWRSFRF